VSVEGCDRRRLSLLLPSRSFRSVGTVPLAPQERKRSRAPSRPPADVPIYFRNTATANGTVGEVSTWIIVAG
jgi:hypothetical protein